ncbi:bacteriophage holin [Saccharothrix sp. BKS2]|uniref:bacteriophage holin n=1 Tax=Saccharothrix sp. BKS2 TaxID=3064400 RepID=UPI0039E85AC7
MPYLSTLLLIALGLVVLVAVAARVVGSLRRFRAASTLVGDRVGDGAGLLRARFAALGVALAERRPDRARQGEPRVPSVDRGRQEDNRAQPRTYRADHHRVGDHPAVRLEEAARHGPLARPFGEDPQGGDQGDAQRG